jgi:ABC-type transport system involved in multi-copper enzyme maturation permease subunit
MMRALGVPIGVAKEVRALLPAWLACMLVAGALAASPADPGTLLSRVLPGLGQPLGALAFVLGPVVLGALAIGHELNYGTLSGLLTHPVSRRSLYARKIWVLATMVLILWIALGIVLYLHASFPFERAYVPLVGYESRSVLSALGKPLVLVPLLAGVFLAPWFTMLCRNAMAGAVLAYAVPATLWLIAQPLATSVFGVEHTNTRAEEAFKSAVVWWGTLAASGVAVFAGRFAFLGLQVLDGPSRALVLPRWPRTAVAHRSAVRRSPRWLLVEKELRLQAPTLAVGALYLLVFVGINLYAGLDAADARVALAAATMMHLTLVSLLAGALVSAEERQWGTLESQLLLPVSAWEQWAIKIAAASAVSVVLAIGLPLLLAAVTSTPSGRLFLLSNDPWRNIEVAVLLTFVGIYVSSLSRGGLRALLGAMAAAAVGAVVLQTWALTVNLTLREILPAGRQIGPTAVGIVISRIHVVELHVASLAILALWFAFRNHRYGGAGRGRIAGQVAWMLAWHTGVVAAFGILTRLWP